MRTLARAATSSLVMLGAALALVVAAVAAIGILGTRAATEQGNEIAGDELTTAVVTGQLARSMDAAYAAGLAALRASAPTERTRLLGSLYTTLLPAVDARLFALDQLHAGGRPAEHADLMRSAGRGPRSGPCSARRTCRPRRPEAGAGLPRRRRRQRPRRGQFRPWPPPTRRSAPTSPGCSSVSSTTPAPTTPARMRARSGPSA